MDIERLVEDDTLPTLGGTVLKDDGTPEDITGWVISLIIDYPTPLVKVATIPLGTDGVYEFPWAVGDLRPGRFRADVKIVSPLGTETFQHTQDDEELYLNISEKL